MIPFRFIPTLFAVVLFWIASPTAGEGREIILGAPTSLKTLEGSESLKAAQMAVAEINGAGGVTINGEPYKFRLAPFDLKEVEPTSPPAEAVARLRAFITEEKPHALVIGPFRSEVLLASMDLLAEKMLPTLGCIAMSPAVDAKILTNPKYKYIFRVGLNTKYLVAYLIETMKLMRRKFGFERVFVLNQDVAWARSTAYLMLRLYLNRSGWQVLGQENYPEGTTDFKDALARAKAGRAQVILAVFDMPSSRNLVMQWQEMKPAAALCGFISPASGPDAWASFQGGLEGVINVIFELGNLPSSKYPPAEVFFEAYNRRYGLPIQAGHGPAPAYESVYILAKAFEMAGTLDPDGVAAALEATDRPGVMGRLMFHRGHQAVFGEDPKKDVLACVAQWQAPGKRVIVYPSTVADGRITLPEFIESVDQSR
ncbi:MAG: ABC transporter substrate-binding protein [Deltaproteobacteria bacterium]|nr:ABC transporter substrate-binding protein [Deltaproteobacteria bacterium]